MDEIEKLDQKLLKEILLNIYEKGETNDVISLTEIMNEIKSKINLVLYSQK